MHIFNAVLQGVMPARCLEATLTDSAQFKLHRPGQTVCKWWRRSLGSIGLSVTAWAWHEQAPQSASSLAPAQTQPAVADTHPLRSALA